MPMLKDQDKAKLRMYRIKKDFIGIELLLPAVVIFLLFSLSPIIKTFVISMQSFTTINQSAFIGLDNFVKIIADSKFWEAFMHSVSLSFIVVLLGTWMPFILALYVYEMRRGSGLMKILYFIPFLTPAVPAAILWKWMYNQGFGLINSILSLFTPARGAYRLAHKFAPGAAVHRAGVCLEKYGMGDAHIYGRASEHTERTFLRTRP